LSKKYFLEGFMKNLFVLFILALSFMFILSCASNKRAAYEGPPVEDSFTTEPEAPPPEEPAPPPPPPPTETQVYEKYSGDIILDGAKTYRVVRGDTLAKIARSQYGSRNGYYFPLILLASRDVVKDPDMLLPGMRLTVPDLQRNLSDPGARQKIKEFLNEIADVYNDRLRKRWGTQTRKHLRALASSL
jgi:hypothetical protein